MADWWQELQNTKPRETGGSYRKRWGQDRLVHPTQSWPTSGKNFKIRSLGRPAVRIANGGDKIGSSQAVLCHANQYNTRGIFCSNNAAFFPLHVMQSQRKWQEPAWEFTIVADHEFWTPIIQHYLNKGLRQRDMPEQIAKDHDGRKISTRSISRLINKYGLKTARQPCLSLSEMGDSILQEQLRVNGTHLPRHFIQGFQFTRDPTEAAARFAGNKTITRKGLVSPGPNEEEQMGIEVWGICDKYSRHELALWAVPNSRLAIVPPALYLMLVKEKKGIPLQTTSDKGSETGQLAAMQTALRTFYELGLSVETLPPHRFVKSVHNITRERGWCPLWNKDLKNVLLAWREGQLEVGYIDSNPTHRMMGVWLWARVVESRLDNARQLNGVHRVRRQDHVLLPTGGHVEDFYNNPEKYDEDTISRLLAEHIPQRLFQFGTDESHALATELFTQVGSPALTSLNAWEVWRAMMAKLPGGLN
ncbi:hypothetical protein JB92DRAFT_3098153 [Gautieria morchelliformis]|nr:hypothetical protein JB92DRAFT_3098153 [Gautieria morchelliformis]